MKIAVLGGGFTGISLAYHLSKDDHEVSLFEKEKHLGGLATSFKDTKWKWSLERYYHHLFTSDKAILQIAKALKQEVLLIKPITSIYYQKTISQFDSPFTLLQFQHLSPIAKIRTSVILAFLKFTPVWQPLEKITAPNFLNTYCGQESWKVIWEPLFISKFGRQINEIPASWFWARIKKRTNYFAYPKGGFESFYQSITKKCLKNGCHFYLNSQINSIQQSGDKLVVKTQNKIEVFDKVICTLPTPIFLKITKGLPANYIKKHHKIQYRGAVNIVLSLKHKFLPDNIYWLNVNDTSFPFLGIVEHTNFIPNKHYNNDNLIYIGNYLRADHRYFNLEKKEIINEFFPYIQKINPKFKKSWIKKSWKFSSPYAQPIMTTNYSRKIPSHQTPIKNLFLANMQQVYPWDRQTNYAVEMGQKVAKIITEKS